MGTFAGHALPGSFFLLFGIWSAIFQLKKYYRRRRYELGLSPRPEPAYKNQLTTPIRCCEGGCCCRGKEFPLDSLLKAVCCLIGIIGEVYTGFKDGSFAHIGNAQHSTMYAMFMLSGILEMINFYRIIRLPKFSDYFFSFLAITTEAVLFAFHLHGRTLADVYVHTILIYAVLCLIVVGVFEAIYPRSLLLGLVRSLFLILQGTWFWHVGAILYPPVSWLPVWNEQAVESIPRATNVFIWHVIVVFGLICLTSAVMGFPLRNSPALHSFNRTDQRHLLSDDENSSSENEILEMH
ncbi:unnamed protein product [Mesocestoides corti]|uniref:Transmembrane protein 45B n=1 Tax=Mesocestoides corti TaxID=53468 RepID=A0A0R3ULR7_MESCO|nr:unnamed protein product [Mesocestoides corti]